MISSTADRARRSSRICCRWDTGEPRDRHRRRASSYLAAGRPPLAIRPMQPRIFGPYEPIRRDYPIAEYLGDLEGSGVTRSVYVQTNWANDRFEDEAAWVQQTADEHGWPHAHRRLCRFRVDDVRPQLDRLRAIRCARRAHATALAREPALPLRRTARSCADPVIRRNVGRLADYGWSFDLQVFAPQMPDAADLPKPAQGDLRPAACRHAGGPFARRPRRLARRHGAPRACPNVV